MPRTCTVCRSERREEIEHALISGEPLRKIAKRTGLSAAALSRHRPHILITLLNAEASSAAKIGMSLWERHQDSKLQTDAILSEARQGGNWYPALRALSQREQQAKLEIELLKLSDRLQIAMGMKEDTSVDLARDYARLTEEELEQYHALTLKLIADKGATDGAGK